MHPDLVVGFSGNRADLPLAGLSGCERVRLVLAMLVSEGPLLLLLDEPTNHLDLDMPVAAAEALESYSGQAKLPAIALAALSQRQGRLRAELEAAEAAWMEALEALENARIEA